MTYSFTVPGGQSFTTVIYDGYDRRYCRRDYLYIDHFAQQLR